MMSSKELPDIELNFVTNGSSEGTLAAPSRIGSPKDMPFMTGIMPQMMNASIHFEPHPQEMWETDNAMPCRRSLWHRANQ